MKDFSRKITRARTPILIVVLLATAVAAYFAQHVTVNTDLVAFLPKNDPHVRLFEEAGRKFGGNYLAIVGLEADDVFTVDVLRTVDQLTRAFQRISGVSSVTSLANVIDFKETEWGVEVAKLLENGKIPTSPEELQRLKQYVLSRSLYRDKLVSHDARVTLIVARLRDDADRMEIAKQLRLQSKAIVGNRYKLYFAGLPFEMEFMGRLIFVDLMRLTPIAALLIVLILYLAFRNSRGVILPFTTVVVSTIWVLGFMGLTGIPLSLVSAATPVLILAVGSAYGIHMLKRYEEESLSSTSPEQATVRALQTIGLPIALAAVTTLVGFLTLLSSQLVIIRQFGIVTGLGVVFALLIATTFVPAVLAHMPLPKKRAPGKRAAKTNWRWLAEALPKHVLNHPGRWVVAASLLSLVAALGIPKITREVNISEYFKPNSEVRVSEKMMEQRFGGSYPAQIVVHGDAKDPAILQLMRQIERRLNATPWLTNPESVADLICEMNRVMNDRYVVPDTRQGVGNLWFLLEGQDVMSQYVAEGNSQAQIQLRIRSMDTGIILRSVNFIDRYLSTLPDTLVTVALDSLPQSVRPLAD
ncbi:MAG: MMPL family transporter, partial [Calditrichaeota bacterium]|nr:MMPL family transporter [Calditrichota bacterium]